MGGAAAQATARGVAIFLGAFCLLNVIGEIRRPHFDANSWWIDVRGLGLAGQAVLSLGAAAMLAWGIRPRAGRWRRRITGGCVLILLAIAIWNCVAYYLALAGPDVGGGVRVPLSAVVVLSLCGILAGVVRGGSVSRRWAARTGTVCTVAFCAVLFPIAQMVFFGHTDYRRAADVAVVFGARVYADGRPSDAVEDRVVEAAELYWAGLCRKVLMSGGPGDGEIHETRAMRRLAIELGVKEEDILTDLDGVNTAATARNAVRIISEAGGRRILAVSQFWHLPRVKMSFQRHGVEVYTVPVRRPLRGTPWYMAREVAAMWVYYLRPLWSGD